MLHSLSRQANSEDVIVCLGHDLVAPEAPKRAVFLLLGLPVLSPKVQSFVVCAPEDADLIDGLCCNEVPAAPFTLWMQKRPSRLCTPTNPCFTTLFHLTSDEVALRLVQSGLSWEAYSVKQDM